MLALVLVALTAIVLVLEHYARGRVRYHRRAPGTARPAPRIRLALALAGVRSLQRVGGFALLLPLAVMIYWLERAVSLGREFVDVWGPAFNSLLARRSPRGSPSRQRCLSPCSRCATRPGGRARSSASRTPPTPCSES